MSHTPGPWKITLYWSYEESKEIGNVEIKDNEGETIIDGCGCCSSPRMKSIHDLHLIAAAPELLEAAMATEFHLISIGQGGNGLHNQVCAAIAKARGQE